MHRITAIAATALAAAATIGATATPAHAASTSSRLKKLEKQMKTVVAANRSLTARVATDGTKIAALRTQLDATSGLLVNCFQSTSMDLGLAPDWLSAFDGTSFLGYQGSLIVPSLHSGNAGPFYLATVDPACVGALTPLPAAAAARSSLQKPATMFPNSELPFRSLPSK